MVVQKNKKFDHRLMSRALLGLGFAGSLFVGMANAQNYSFNSMLLADASHVNSIKVSNTSQSMACANCMTPDGQLNAANLNFVASRLGLDGAKASLFALQFESSGANTINANSYRFLNQKKNYGQLPTSLTRSHAAVGSDTLFGRNVKSERMSFPGSTSLGLGFQSSKSVSYGVHISRSSQIAYTTNELARMNSLTPDSSSLLAAPVERTTSRAELSMLYNTGKIRSKITYQTSSFRDGSLSSASDWQIESFDEVNSQRYSSPLDNGSQQLSFAGAYDVFSNTTASALLAMGQSRRTDYLLQQVSNDPADRGLNTYSGNLQLMSRLTPHFELNFNYAEEQQSSKINRNSKDNDYEVLSASLDSSTGNRANLPQSFRKRTTKLAGQYKLPAHSAVKLGVDYETYNRIDEEDNITRENSYWAEFKTQPHRTIGVSLTVEKSAREGAGYTYDSIYKNLSPKQQLLQKYDLASRDRNKAGLAINLSPLDSLNIGFAFDSSNNAYSDSQVGLTDSKETSYTFDANFMISKFIAVSGFYSTELIYANQTKGQLSPSSLNAYSDNEDQIDTAGIGLDYHIIANKFDVGFDYIHAQASGKVNLDTQSSVSDLRASSNTLHLYSKYQYSDVLHFQVAYRYEKFVDINSVGDAIGLANTADPDAVDAFNPKYNIGEFALSMRYRF